MLDDAWQWEQVARHLPVPLAVAPGDTLHVAAAHTDCYLQTLKLSNYTAEMLVRGGTETAGVMSNLVGNPSAAGLSVAMERPVARSRVEKELKP